ncbi:ThiF family adenylyltransferase [Kribbella sp. NPDC000426]|uniref:ThiF family adenylyltransferase n=1 Tax=Kribbella sp. NPDC000426 TaxID=3154255 RepID=UPI00332D8CB4
MTIRITDYAVHRINEALGENPPEQGGVLFGPPESTTVTSFVHDVGAQTTGSVYHNSPWIIAEIERIESVTPATFKGVVHSHPHYVPQPSSQDLREYTETLRSNPQMTAYVAPIVTHDVATPPARHEFLLGQARFSFFRAERSFTHEATLVADKPQVIPVAESLEAAGASFTAEPVLVPSGDQIYLGGQYDFPGIGSVTVMLPLDYPASPPLIYDEDDRPLSLSWDLQAPGAERLRLALRNHLTERSGPKKERPGGTTMRAAGDLFARSRGILSTDLRNRQVLVVGCGSVGSYVAELLVRAGVESLTLIDPDIVEPGNLGRSLYSVSDIGLSKVAALHRRISAINASARVDVHRAALSDLDPDLLVSAIRRSDLVVGATDDNVAQLRTSQLAYWSGTPSIYPGLYRGAHGGEVILSIPGGPCWDCSTAGVRESNGEARTTDYGTGRLVAEPGLLADIHHLSSAACKLALGLLEHDPSMSVSQLMQAAIDQRLTYLLMGMAPNYWLFPEALSSAWGQLAFQSIWMQAESRPECSTCGDLDDRLDPMSVSRTPSTVDRGPLLQALLAERQKGPTVLDEIGPV